MNRRSIPFIVVTWLLGSGLAAQPDSDLRTRLDAAVAPYVAAGDFMGVVALQTGEQEPLLASYGLARVGLGAKQGIAHTSGSVFKVGSISKQFTATAILLLEESGELDVSERVSAYLPWFKPNQPITLHHLLTHTAGVIDVYSLPRFGRSAGAVADWSQVLADLNEAPLTFPPGQGYQYSNGNYSILAAVIEAVSGQSYGDYMERALFEPLGLLCTAHGGAAAARLDRVPGYQPRGSRELEPAPPIAAAFTTGSGSLWSCRKDLLRWNHLLYSGSVLSAASYNKLVTDYGQGYGYGLSVFQRFGT